MARSRSELTTQSPLRGTGRRAMSIWRVQSAVVFPSPNYEWWREGFVAGCWVFQPLSRARAVDYSDPPPMEAP